MKINTPVIPHYFTMSSNYVVCFYYFNSVDRKWQRLHTVHLTMGLLTRPVGIF